jgi:protein-S-isoprenylcysteine O-methyltransferase Ste14
MAAVLPDRFFGAIYALASGIVLTAVVLLWQTSPTHWVMIRGPALWVARGCGLFAAAVFLWSLWALRTFDPLGFGPIRAHLRQVRYRPPPFVLRGPYRWVRHPLYACILVFIWTAPDLTSDRMLFDWLWTVWIVIGARLEEADLLARFGDTYRSYQRKIPMLIPWRGPDASG